MPAQFIMNLFIAFLWMLLIDEDKFYISTFFAGYLVGIGIIFIMHRFFGRKFYLHRLYAAIKLIILFVSEIFHSTVLVLKHVLSPKLNLRPGIFKYETKLTSDIEVTTLAMLLTLTPGSVVMEVAPEGNVFYIHGMDLEQSKDALLHSLAKFEKAIMEVTR
jgi:multicomponent Na+:H+ antiporter subunit E